MLRCAGEHRPPCLRSPFRRSASHGGVARRSLGGELGSERPVTRRLSLEAVLPVAYETGGGRSGLALGNVTAGAGYGWAVGRSVSFPTAPDSGDGKIANLDALDVASRF